MIEFLDGVKETVKFRNDFSVILYDNDKAEDYPSHWHVPLEIITPLEGGYRVICNDETFILCEGDVLIICPGVLHKVFAPIKGRRLILQVALSSIATLNLIGSIVTMISPALLITRAGMPEISRRMNQLLCEICDEYFGEAPYKDSAIYSRIINLFVIIGRTYTNECRHFNNRPTKQLEYTEKFRSVCDYIDQHFFESLTLDDVAKVAGFSKYHFTRLFKQFTDMSFYQYLNKRRITHAEMLLTNPGISITEVSLQCGFSNISAFIRMFKLHENCTPSEFRVLNRNGI